MNDPRHAAGCLMEYLNASISSTFGVPAVEEPRVWRIVARANQSQQFHRLPNHCLVKALSKTADPALAVLPTHQMKTIATLTVIPIHQEDSGSEKYLP